MIKLFAVLSIADHIGHVWNHVVATIFVLNFLAKLRSFPLKVRVKYSAPPVKEGVCEAMQKKS